jgi:integrase
LLRRDPIGYDPRYDPLPKAIGCVMAFLTKQTVIRWIDPRTKARVPAHTPGAKKVRKKTECFYIVDKSSGKVRRIPTNCTDRAAAQAALTKYNRAVERNEQGLTDPFKRHRERPIVAHLNDYVATVRESSRYPAYPRTIERELTKLFRLAAIVQLGDMTADRIQQYLSGLTGVKAATKNKLRTYLMSFGRWLTDGDRISRNPVERVKPAVPKLDEAEKRRRRALRVKELSALLSAVDRYPLVSAQRPKGGRPRKDGTKARYRNPVALSDATVSSLLQQGRERRLLYRTALLTGLRRGELARLRVRYFKRKRNLFDVPGQVTKNGRPAQLPIAPALAADLGQWITETGRKADDSLFSVPEARNMVRQHRARLTLAGVTYKTKNGFADFHSLRKTINTFLRRQGMDLRIRQRFLRHAATDLATTAYDDERLRELKPVVNLLTILDERLAKMHSDPLY